MTSPDGTETKQNKRKTTDELKTKKRFRAHLGLLLGLKIVSLWQKKSGVRFNFIVFRRNSSFWFNWQYHIIYLQLKIAYSYNPMYGHNSFTTTLTAPPGLCHSSTVHVHVRLHHCPIVVRCPSRITPWFLLSIISGGLPRTLLNCTSNKL